MSSISCRTQAHTALQEMGQRRQRQQAAPRSQIPCPRRYESPQRCATGRAAAINQIFVHITLNPKNALFEAVQAFDHLGLPTLLSNTNSKSRSKSNLKSYWSSKSQLCSKYLHIRIAGECRQGWGHRRREVPDSPPRSGRRAWEEAPRQPSRAGHRSSSVPRVAPGAYLDEPSGADGGARS